MKKTFDFGLIGGLLAIAVVVAGFVGWILNIGALVHSDHLSGMVIARAIGVFVAPLGAVLGFI